MIGLPPVIALIWLSAQHRFELRDGALHRVRATFADLGTLTLPEHGQH